MAYVDLTPTQLQLLKTDILADPVLSAWAATGRMSQEIADEYNKLASPAWIVWRTYVEPDEWLSSVMYSPGAGVQLDGLNAGKRECLLWAFQHAINPSNAAARTTLTDWCGSQTTLRDAIKTVQKRNATRAEKLFSTGTGTTASPATMGWEGVLSYQDVEAALAL